MCLLTYFEPGVQPDCQALHCGATTNDDGHGFAIVDVDNRRIITERYLTAATAIDRFAKMRAALPAGPALFHSRWATHGTVDLTNVHPFNVDGDKRTVVAHNGVLPLECQPRDRLDTRSDTAILAASMAWRFGALRKPSTRDAVETWMGKGNKLVILTVNRRYHGNAFILNEDAGIWTPEGIWYSNEGYLPAVKRWYSYYASTGMESSTVAGDKWWQGTCNDCNRTYEWCACDYTDVSGGGKKSTAWNDPTGWMLNGDLECWSCKQPRRGCQCGPNKTSARCPGCFQWLMESDHRTGNCGVCHTCLECELPPDGCDCYEPQSSKTMAMIASKAIAATVHRDGGDGFEGASYTVE